MAFDAPKALKAKLISTVNESLLREIEERMGFGGDMDIEVDFGAQEEEEKMDESDEDVVQQFRLLSLEPLKPKPQEEPEEEGE